MLHEWCGMSLAHGNAAVSTWVLKGDEIMVLAWVDLTLASKGDSAPTTSFKASLMNHSDSRKGTRLM